MAALLLLYGAGSRSWADDPVKFDLAGPKVNVQVQRGTLTLPISEVPNLLAGDKLLIKADLPSTQANHLLLIVAFLRGTTNEPPEDWFHEIETWNKKTMEGTTITVPEGAEQALMFIAPETGGDFKTLRGAVRGRPGLFIRADAELNEASFEQLRIQRYLAAMKKVDSKDPKVIADRSQKLAATLALKPNPDCFKQPVDQQVTCLTQGTVPVLLNDGHEMTVSQALSSGTAQDLASNASLTPQAGYGLYSAYVGVIVDVVHIVNLMRTAQYQYIPALSLPEGPTLNLKLNAPPSFINPKSVIVIALPAVQAARLPPLKPAEADEISCLKNPKMVMRIEGAPLVFSTALAHDMVLHLNRTGSPVDLPLQADAEQGGLVVAPEKERKPLEDAMSKANDAVKPQGNIGSATDLTISGTVEGFWGFDHFEGPTLTLQQVGGKDWKIVGDPQLLAGQDSKFTLKADGTACVEHIALSPAPGANDAKEVDVSYAPAKTDGGKPEKDALALSVSLKTIQPGGYSLCIKQYGDENEAHLPLTAYNADIKLDKLTIHAGDHIAVLTGKGLGSLVSLELDGQTFTPAAGSDDATTHLEARADVTPKDGDEAKAKLKDGRVLPIKVTAEAARPSLKLVSMNSSRAEDGGALPVVLGGKDEIPLHGKLTFVVTTTEVFPRAQKIEVATANEGVKTTLSLADNNLVLQDEHTAVVTLNPFKAFGQSAFGPLAMRPIAADGSTGDWTRLGILVRTPEISAVNCAADAPTCTVDGKNLFLVQAFGADQSFAKAADVPTGFAQGEFTVPTPADGTTLYLKLRDDPSSAASVKLPPKPASTPTPTATPGPAAPKP
jgi:hypothetical protein